MSDESVVGREECPECGSKDNVAVYSDGHRHCFTPGCGYHTAAEGEATTRKERKTLTWKPIEGDYRAIPKRALSADACRKYGVRVGTMGGEVVLAMDYRDGDSLLVAQKVRSPDKRFTILGEPKKMRLFGQHLYSGTGRRVVVTEGELDAVALAQAQDLKWPVVSIPNGADSARKSLAAARDWLEGYEEVVLAFDADEPGRVAASAAASVLTPGKVRIAEMPPGCKDANEALVQGKVAELLRCVWNARVYRPDGIVKVSDIKGRILEAKPEGAPWPWPSVTAATYGRHAGELIGFGAGTGIGKTDLFTQMIAFDITAGIPTGVIYLEQDVAETATRIAGKVHGKVFHIPDGSWTPKELSDAVDALETQPLSLFDSFGAMDWPTIEARMRYMVQVEGARHLFFDHLTAVAAAAADERIALEQTMASMASLAKSLGVVLHFVSHLTTPEQGASHEEGGRVTIRQFKGSRAIGFWSHRLFGLERNQQAGSQADRCVTTLRCLKDRFSGRATGMTWRLRYDPATGLLHEVDETAEQFDEAAANEAGF